MCQTREGKRDIPSPWSHRASGGTTVSMDMWFVGLLNNSGGGGSYYPGSFMYYPVMIMLDSPSNMSSFFPNPTSA